MLLTIIEMHITEAFIIARDYGCEILIPPVEWRSGFRLACRKAKCDP